MSAGLEIKSSRLTRTGDDEVGQDSDIVSAVFAG
jgi:hypothetical protein